MKDDEKTRKLDRQFAELQAADLPRDHDPDPDMTRKLKKNPDQRSEKSDSNPTRKLEGDKTVLVRPGGKNSGGETGYHPFLPGSEVQDATNELDPVVGWLVVVKGPGRGNAVRLGYHWNSIGRDPDQRVSLDFGDTKISRKTHAKLNYEPRARKFTITIGDGINPTYVRGENLLGPAEIKTGDRIEVGETELMFVALCGESFDWDGNP